MKKFYNSPEMELVLFTDVIITSAGGIGVGSENTSNGESGSEDSDPFEGA